MIYLASQSPRRRELLRRMGLDFTVRTAPVDETMDETKPLAEEIARVSRRKAEAILGQVTPEDVIIAADTLVTIDGRRLGKPRDEKQAAQMLRSLSGRTHQVLTGVSVLRGSRAISATEETTIHFRPLTEAEIAAYIATGEPMDKAGAYGIQGFASIFVDYMRGDYYNVMGLPVCRLTGMLRQFGVTVLG